MRFRAFLTIVAALPLASCMAGNLAPRPAGASAATQAAMVKTIEDQRKLIALLKAELAQAKARAAR